MRTILLYLLHSLAVKKSLDWLGALVSVYIFKVWTLDNTFAHSVESASANFSGHYSASKGYNTSTTGVKRSTCSSPEVKLRTSSSQSECVDNTANTDGFRSCIASETAPHNNSDSMTLDPPLRSNNNIRKPLPHRSRSTRTQAVFVVGPPGYSPVLFDRQHLTTI